MARAAALRVFAMCCGAISVIWLIQYAVEGKEYQAAVFAMVITVGLAVVAASLKVFARVRRLSTELHRRSLAVIRGLEELRDAHEPDEARRLGRAVVRAWDGLDEVLRNKVETGFHLNGTFVLPRDAIRSLEAAVTAAVEEPADDHLHQVAVDRMNILRAAGTRRLDSFA